MGNPPKFYLPTFLISFSININLLGFRLPHQSYVVHQILINCATVTVMRLLNASLSICICSSAYLLSTFLQGINVTMNKLANKLLFNYLQTRHCINQWCHKIIRLVTKEHIALLPVKQLFIFYTIDRLYSHNYKQMIGMKF